MNVGNRIRDRRKLVGKSAEELADQIRISRATMYRYEQGAIKNIPAQHLNAIAMALSTTIEYLLGNTESPDIPILWDDIKDKKIPLEEQYTDIEKHLVELYRTTDPSLSEEILWFAIGFQERHPFNPYNPEE